MTSLGWIFMIVSWVLILGLAVLCFCKVFKKKEMD